MRPTKAARAIRGGNGRKAEGYQKWAMVVRREAPVRSVRGGVRYGSDMDPGVQAMIQCADATAILKEGGEKRNLKCVCEMCQMVGMGPGEKRWMGALRCIPAGVEIPDHNA